MYVSTDLLALGVGLLAYLAYIVFNRWWRDEHARRRKEHEELQEGLEHAAIEAVHSEFLRISDGLELETDYERNQERFHDDTDSWMHARDVKQAARQNVSNARIVLASLDEFIEDIADDYRLKRGDWSDARRLFESYAETLRKIDKAHAVEAESMIEDYLDTPALALKPRSQMYVEAVADQVRFGFESTSRELRLWLEGTGVEKIR